VAVYTGYAENRKVGKPNNLKASNKPKGLARIAKID